MDLVRRCRPQFLDKNRRDIDKSRSTKRDAEMTETSRSHVIGAGVRAQPTPCEQSTPPRFRWSWAPRCSSFAAGEKKRGELFHSQGPLLALQMRAVPADAHPLGFA
jgi:hypothetical protein